MCTFSSHLTLWTIQQLLTSKLTSTFMYILIVYFQNIYYVNTYSDLIAHECIIMLTLLRFL